MQAGRKDLSPEQAENAAAAIMRMLGASPEHVKKQLEAKRAKRAAESDADNGSTGS